MDVYDTDDYKITVLVIATNSYTQFLPNLFHSIDTHLATNYKIQILLFTDENGFKFQIDKSERVNVEKIKISSYGWPEATLLRYKIFSENWHLVQGKYVMYLDADTEVVNDVSLEEIVDALGSKSVGLISHPGYFNRGLFINFLNKLSFKIGWEARKRSTAYVRFIERKRYICGGVWFGKTEMISKLVNQLVVNVDLDLSRGVIAKFHDESHLNYWLVKNTDACQVLDPRWAFEPTYSNLNGLVPFIKVLNKPAQFNLAKQN